MTLAPGYSLLAEDIDHVYRQGEPLWSGLRGIRLFVSGGSGFVGAWLLESFLWANDRLGSGAEVVVLTRDPEKLTSRRPHLLKHPALTFWKGSMTDFPFPAGEFAYVIHAASESYKPAPGSDSVALFKNEIAGTNRMLDFAVQAGARAFLFTSSGAAYGPQPSHETKLSEEMTPAPETVDADSGYGQAKRVSEWLCSAYAQRHGLEARIARLFTFVGPHVPPDSHFPSGNFIRDALRGGPIRITGDGTPCRSYLYAADLAIWLWAILFRGKTSHVYNVGSDAPVTIAELARIVSEVGGADLQVIVEQKADPSRPTSRYIPAIERARHELGLEPWIGIREAIRRTVFWHKSQGTR